RVGPAGAVFSYDSLAKNRDAGWPEHFEGRDLRLTPIKPGVVYGTYRYRVRFGADEQTGLSERIFVSTPSGWKIAVSTAFPSIDGIPPPPLAVVGATLVDGNGGAPVPNATILIRDGKIDAAGPSSSVRVPAGVDTLDARGCWVLPGLIDAHVHYSQTGWADGRPDAMDLRARFPYPDVERRLRDHPERFHRAWLACGVTGVFDVGGYAWTLDMARAVEKNTEAPHISAAGPLLSTVDHWLNLPGEKQLVFLHDSLSAVEGVRYLKSLGAAAVKIWFIVRPGSDFEAMDHAVRIAGQEAHAQGLRLIVHATGLKEAKAALKDGADYLVHSVQDLPVDEEFLSMAKRNHTLYCPTLTVLDGYVNMRAAAASGGVPDVDDPNGAVDSLTLAHVRATAAEAKRAGVAVTLMTKGRLDSLHAQMAANLRAVRDAGIPIVMGTDAGNPLTLHGPAIYAELETMQKDGLSPMEVIVAATRNGARAMGREADLGTIAAGKLADLAIVGADPTRDVANLRKLRWVVRDGVVRSSEELRRAVALTH
ncbi:MAG TPA: amidohydrolase family protein, partial [Candidatus Sulfotelmatobacter sp.]|nr:amidohydrolase family protein [Candidatus Sulfotelmatobacter sp.]